MKLRQEYLVVYDIESNKSRLSIYKKLLAYGLKSVQKSVFWGYLTLAEKNAIARLLNNALDKTDKAFMTHVSMQRKSFSYKIGHHDDDFKDWEEHVCL